MSRVNPWPTLNELKGRWSKLQFLMAEHGLEGALFLQNADLIYVCGTTQAEAVFLPRVGQPLLLARPPLERVQSEAPWAMVQPMPTRSQLGETLRRYVDRPLNLLGLELDVLPVDYFRRLAKDALPDFDLVDVSPMIRQARVIKSPFEIQMMRQSALELDAAFQAAPGIISPGITEVELESRMVAILRGKGHQGLIRCRGLNMEIFFGHVLSGPSGLIPAKVASPTGGQGIDPGSGQGASLRPIGPHELVSIDLCGTYGAYITDQTRLFYTGPVPAALQDLYARLLAMLDDLVAYIRPGVPAGQVYDQAFALAAKQRLGEGFMTLGGTVCPFIGHGIGLELDEWPALAKGAKMPLSAGMTFALEPRVFVPGLGVVGLENTYHLTENGPEVFNVTSTKLVSVM